MSAERIERFAELDRLIAAEPVTRQKVARRREPRGPLTSIPAGAFRVKVLLPRTCTELKREPRNCEGCGAEIMALVRPGPKAQRYCSDACKTRHRIERMRVEQALRDAGTIL